MRAASAAALLAAAGCGDDVVEVPLREFASVPLRGQFSYYDEQPRLASVAASFVELDRHPDCSALNEPYTARFNGQRIEASSLGGLGPPSGDSGPSCSWPLFPVVETRTDALPTTFSDGDFELEDASHRMRLRVRDWVGPHGPVLPGGTVDVVQGEDLVVPWLPASADLSAVSPQVLTHGQPGPSLARAAEPGVLRVRTTDLAVGTHTLRFSGFASLEVLECTGAPRCDVGYWPHSERDSLRVRVLAP